MKCISRKMIPGALKIFLSILAVVCCLLLMITPGSALATTTRLKQPAANDTVKNRTVTKKAIAETGVRTLPHTAIEHMLRPGENIDAKVSANLFLRAIPERKSCYIGETVLITYKLYSRLVATSTIARQPVLGGFSVYDMNDIVALRETVETFNNRSFKVHVLKKSQLLPLQSGDLVLDRMELDNTVHFVKMDAAEPLPGRSLGALLEELSAEEAAPALDHRVTVGSKPVTIIVKPLPEMNRPPDFTGAIGKFSISSSIAPGTIPAYGIALLKVEVKGIGNIPLIGAPIINWPAGIDSMDMRSIDSFDKTVAPLQGIKTFEFRFSPATSGNFTIPPVTFSYFDPALKSYKTISSAYISFEVIPGNVIKDNASLKAAGGFREVLVQQWLWILSVTLLVIICLVLWRKNSVFKSRVPAVEPVCVVTQPLKDVLLECRTLLKQEDYKAFYNCLHHDLWKLLADTLKLSPSELNKNTISHLLSGRGWENDMISRLEEVLTNCERSAYLPGYKQDIDAAIVLEMAERILHDLEG